MGTSKPSKSIPKSAKKVFSGVIFDVYQWEQELYDGTYTTFEKLKRPDTVEAICTVKDKIILLEQSQPGKEKVLCLPAGRMDRDAESTDECMRREIMEETGYRVDGLRLWFMHRPFSKIDWTVHIFISNNLMKVSEQNLDPGEKIELRFFSYDEFLMLSEEPRFNDREVVKQLFMARLYPEKREQLRRLIWNLN